MHIDTFSYGKTDLFLIFLRHLVALIDSISADLVGEHVGPFLNPFLKPSR